MIKIGRSNACEIPIEDNSLSKFQAAITFDPEKGWIIRDGYEGRPSTNGTWLYLSEAFEIYDGLVFKTQQIIFKVEERMLSDVDLVCVDYIRVVYKNCDNT